MKNPFYLFFFFLLFLHPTIAQDINLKEAFNELYGGLFEADEPGGSILLLKGDEVYFQGNYGLANIDTGEKITEKTIFNTGSISKTFVSNAILILHERGKLSVHDPISKYFDDFDQSEISEKVTIELLLSHTSGLPDLRDVRNNYTFFLSAKDKENWEPIKKTKKLNFESGSKFEYSNPAFNGLALIIEKVSGMKWQTFVEKEIFDIVSMEGSTITDGPHPMEGVAHGYVKSGERFKESDYGEVPTFAAAGNGGVWSSVIELAKYARGLDSSSFLSKEMIEKSRVPFHPSNWKGEDNPNIGYSWFLDDGSRFGLSSKNVKIVYHTGSQGGFRSFFISIPEKDIVYIALFNRPFNAYGRVMEEGLRIIEDANWFDK